VDMVRLWRKIESNWIKLFLKFIITEPNWFVCLL
jgi:hypothetical protein